MKQTIVILIMSLTFMNCSKDEPNSNSTNEFNCFDNELVLITDSECCDAELNFLICEILEVEAINRIDDQSFSWLPNACSELNTEVVFKSNNQETKFTLEERKRYILHEELLLFCNEDYEHGTYIEQKNEIIELAYLNDLFGSDTIYFELRSVINSYENQTPNPKVDIFSMLHRRSNTNIANFYVRHLINQTNFDFNSKTYHDEIELNGESYNSVVEFKLRQNVWAEPHTRLYVNQDFGFFGFEKNQLLWIKE